MLSCTTTRGPCSGLPAPDPPPCPTPPKKPFPWKYVYALLTFLGLVGLIYKYYLYKLAQSRNAEFKPIWRPRRKIRRPYHSKDLPACVQYLLVGAGESAWAAYKAIMEHDKKAKVFLITKEDILPYRRAPMSKHMWWNANPPDLNTLAYVQDMKRHTMYQSTCSKFMDPVKFYRKKEGPAVSIATGWSVLRVDADEHVVWIKDLCGETPMYYERCLLAPGSKAKNLTVFKTAPKSVRERVCTLRTIRDLEIAYRKVMEAKHVTIIGGGFLGTELAWHLARMHQNWNPPPDEGFVPLQLTQVVKDAGLLASVVPEYLAEWASEKVKCDNVQVVPKTCVYDAYESPEDGRLRLTLSNGTTLVTDYVFVCVGSKPREELAIPSLLELDPINGGFKVNTELEIRKHLYVSGDAASVYSQMKDSRLRFEHLINAEETGHVAGNNMTGYWTPCNVEPHYWLRLGDVLEVEVVGEVGACMSTVALFKQCAENEDSIAFDVRRGEYGKPCYKQSDEYKNRYKRGILFYIRDETVVGMVFWNFPAIDDRKEVVTELLRAKPSYRDINLLAELLGYPEAECNIIPPEQQIVIGPCIQNYKVW